jgi:hypothetical protein
MPRVVKFVFWRCVSLYVLDSPRLTYLHQNLAILCAQCTADWLERSALTLTFFLKRKLIQAYLSSLHVSRSFHEIYYDLAVHHCFHSSWLKFVAGLILSFSSVLTPP